MRGRDANSSDVDAILRIYAHAVLHSLATFEETVPTLEEMAARRAGVVAAGPPYLVADVDGVVAGYAYAAPYRPRSAYRHTLESSIYVEHGRKGRGLGRALMAALIARCEAGPWHQLVATIGDSANAASLALHARMGFCPVGTLRAVGFKHGRWVDTVLMQRTLRKDSSD